MLRICLLSALLGATTVHAETFSHARLDTLLGEHVDGAGRVDYEALAAAPATLQAYVAALAACSPDNCPARFATRNERLAYWINAYNALVLQAVVDHWPLTSVADVEDGLDGFFRHERHLVGGDSLSLDDIENRIIRPRFHDPRIHFAVNCAATSCPALDDRAFRGDDLDDHLDRRTRGFVADTTHVAWRGDHLRVSKLLDWYGEDFIRWFPQAPPADGPPTLVDYLRLYAPPELLGELPSGPVSVRFGDYDWALNGQPSSRDRAGPPPTQ